MGKPGVAAYMCSPRAEGREMGGTPVLMGYKLQVHKERPRLKKSRWRDKDI